MTALNGQFGAPSDIPVFQYAASTANTDLTTATLTDITGATVTSRSPKTARHWHSRLPTSTARRSRPRQ